MSDQSVEAIDANIILRFVMQDNEQAERAGLLLRAAEKGEKTLLLLDLALADVVWVLEKVYKVSRRSIRETVTELLSLRGIRCNAGKPLVHEALALYSEKNIDWSDAYIAAQMTGMKIKRIYSFDKHFDRISDIQRIEP